MKARAGRSDKRGRSPKGVSSPAPLYEMGPGAPHSSESELCEGDSRQLISGLLVRTTGPCFRPLLWLSSPPDIPELKSRMTAVAKAGTRSVLFISASAVLSTHLICTSMHRVTLAQIDHLDADTPRRVVAQITSESAHRTREPQGTSDFPDGPYVLRRFFARVAGLARLPRGNPTPPDSTPIARRSRTPSCAWHR